MKGWLYNVRIKNNNKMWYIKKCDGFKRNNFEKMRHVLYSDWKINIIEFSFYVVQYIGKSLYG